MSRSMDVSMQNNVMLTFKLFEVAPNPPHSNRETKARILGDNIFSYRCLSRYFIKLDWLTIISLFTSPSEPLDY